MLKTINFLTVFLMAVNLSGRTSLDDGLIFQKLRQKRLLLIRPESLNAFLINTRLLFRIKDCELRLMQILQSPCPGK